MARMSDIVIDSANPEAFRARTVAGLLIVGILGFIGMLVMGAYAPDMRSGRNGGAHALSNAATGFSGIVRLTDATGRGGQIVRNERFWDTEDLVVVTPEKAATNMSKVISSRTYKPTLVVLPKWETVADKKATGWVRMAGLKSKSEPQGVLAPGDVLQVGRVRGGARPLVAANILLRDIHFVAPRPLQTISGENLKPLITDQNGNVVVGQLGEGPLYILADPDLLSNFGMKNARQAEAALKLLDFMNSTGAESINFDVTLNGFGSSLSPLKLAFDPPFLAITLAIAAAMLLAALQALGRFGSPRPRPRAIAFGKAALVDNAAMLLRKAGRVKTLGSRYADMIRDRAAVAFGVPARLRDTALDAYLDRLGVRARFTDLATVAAAADDRHSLLAAAQALHNWKKEKSR
jgi:hypothetical protein